MQLECTNILEAKPIRRAAKMSTELRDRMDVGLLRRRRQIADRHVLDHAPAERAHRRPSGTPVSEGGLQPHPLRQETADQQPFYRGRAANPAQRVRSIRKKAR